MSSTRTPTRTGRPLYKSFSQAFNYQLAPGYLERLRRLIRLRRDHFDELNEEGIKLLDRSIFASYCDCLDIGQSEAALKILDEGLLKANLPSDNRKFVRIIRPIDVA